MILGGGPTGSGARIPALDGLRGLLACVVVASHALVLLGTEALYLAAYGAVWAFFVMSGLVLSRSYDGRYLPFLIRRLVRLWPVYGLCLLAGYGVLREPPDWRVLVWCPWPDLSVASDWFRPDLPAWSLCVEAWAMPFMPLIAWFGRGSVARAILIVPIWWLLRTDSHLYWLWLFMLGGVLSRWTPVCPPLESAMPQWLGRVSYSLYLSHWPVMLVLLGMFGRAGIVCGIPFVVGVGWLVWKYVERPSIALSRQVSASDAGIVVPIG